MGSSHNVPVAEPELPCAVSSETPLAVQREADVVDAHGQDATHEDDAAIASAAAARNFPRSRQLPKQPRLEPSHVATLSKARELENSSFAPPSRSLLEVGSALLLVSASDDGAARLWKLESAGSSGECIRKFDGHCGIVWAAAVSADGRMLATCGSDGTALVHLVHEGERVAKLDGHTDAVMSVVFSGGGELLTASRDGTAKEC
eukprot:TRINITY_DN7536_c0_g1_i1.p2 TRINITY_DN7536_c0_g1~~TRINITY_DN7536_c0_g1_i1.p2  ORF type:complete len:204 (+),score=41.89 TRINITY_DN7536_c0_g1_i1:17-628(+)